MQNAYIKKLKATPDLPPQTYDGSYELVKETIKQYQQISLENANYPDIDLIFFMTVGTWAYGIEKRKELIQQTSLDKPKKDYLTTLLDQINEKAQNGQYTHTEYPNKPTIGMFGSGFSTFKGKCDQQTIKKFITLIVNASRITEEEQLLNYLETELQSEYKGIGIATFSQILHCLNPYIFPIINGNMGEGTNVYTNLGIEIDTKITPQNYIKNLRKIRDFRNKNFEWKNYRIMDILKIENIKQENPIL